ncbi:MAG: hypothetical protein LBG68_03600 [Coriobacteriales bacterium]|jgi:hypothetical protein|nr:hypothetical protein [Coriobacteriales bacterium]
MHVEQGAIRDELKPIDRRLKTLDENIKQSGYIKEFLNQQGISTTEAERPTRIF